MIRKEKHIEIRLRVLEQLDEMLGLVKTGDGVPRASQSDNRPIDHRLQGRFHAARCITSKRSRGASNFVKAVRCR
jgi:hypothetical protein